MTKKENLFARNGAKASVKALEAFCNAKLSHTSKALLRPPPTRALPQSRHSERGAFTRLSAKNLLATLASQTPILLWQVTRGDPSATLRMTRELAPKTLAKSRSCSSFYPDGPSPPAVISTGRNFTWLYTTVFARCFV